MIEVDDQLRASKEKALKCRPYSVLDINRASGEKMSTLKVAAQLELLLQGALVRAWRLSKGGVILGLTNSADILVEVVDDHGEFLVEGSQCREA